VITAGLNSTAMTCQHLRLESEHAVCTGGKQTGTQGIREMAVRFWYLYKQPGI